MESFPTTDSTGARIPNPARPIQESIRANSLIFAADSGHEQRRKRGSSYTTWELTYPALTLAQYLSIRNFFIARTNIEVFRWTHPVSGITYTVRFDTEEFRSENFAHSSNGPLYKLSFALRETI